MLVGGSPEQVREHWKRLIETVAKDGAFIMDASAGLDDARADNAQALFDATREYGCC